MSLVRTFLVRKVSIFSKNLSSTRHARLRAGRFYAKWTPKENFPIKQAEGILLIQQILIFLDIIGVSVIRIDIYSAVNTIHNRNMHHAAF